MIYFIQYVDRLVMERDIIDSSLLTGQAAPVQCSAPQPPNTSHSTSRRRGGRGSDGAGFGETDDGHGGLDALQLVLEKRDRTEER